MRSSDHTYIEEGLGVPSGVPCGQHSDIFAGLSDGFRIYYFQETWATR